MLNEELQYGYNYDLYFLCMVSSTAILCQIKWNSTRKHKVHHALRILLGVAKTVDQCMSGRKETDCWLKEENAASRPSCWNKPRVEKSFCPYLVDWTAEPKRRH